MIRKKVFLVSANTEAFPMPAYPLSLARLAGAVEQAGHQARQFDVLVHGIHELPGTLKGFQPDLVGLSLRNIDNIDAEDCCSYFSGYSAVMEIIRAHTNAPVVLGGSGFSIFPEEFMSRLGGDFGVIGPGEEALCLLLQDMGRGHGEISRIIKGADLSRNGAGPAIFRSLHEPALVDYYWRAGGMIGLQTKRGCPRACSYCTYPLIDGRISQCAGITGLVDEMELLARKLGVSYFFLVDSVYNQDAEHELAFAEEILRRNLQIRWGAFFSPAGINREYIATLKKSGLTHVEFGTDALSDRMLSSYQKGFTAAEAMTSSALTRELGLHTAHYLLLGGPGETHETIRETLANAKRLTGCTFFPLAGVRIYPGTGIFSRARRENLVQEAKDCFDPVFYFPPGFGSADIWRMMREETHGLPNWVLPSRYAEMAPAMQRLRRHGYKGPLWEYLVRN